MLKKLNFLLSSLLPPKLYWYLAGLIHPWEAVIEEAQNPVQFYKQGQGIVRLLKKIKLIHKKTRVLDIGCGAGRVEYALRKEVEKCVGVDISPSMIKLAQKYVKGDNVEFLVTGGKDLKEVETQKFDLAFSILVFQHLPRKIFLKYLQQAYLMLKEGGRLFFQISIYQDQKPKEPPQNHPWALRYYRLNELKKLLEKLKFKNVKFFNVSGDKLRGNEPQAFILASKE